MAGFIEPVTIDERGKPGTNAQHLIRVERVARTLCELADFNRIEQRIFGEQGQLDWRIRCRGA